MLPIKINFPKLETIGGLIATAFILVLFVSVFWAMTWATVVETWLNGIHHQPLLYLVFATMQAFMLFMSAVAQHGFSEIRREWNPDYEWVRKPLIYSIRHEPRILR